MPVPVLTVAQMRAWEQATWAAGVTEAEVIARVGGQVARKVRELAPPGTTVLLLTGKGNNGKDVLAAVPHLDRCLVKQLPVENPAVAVEMLATFLNPRPALIVDGLFGIGLKRPLSPEWCRLIEAVNASGAPVLAVDVPSGLDADTGGHFGAAIRATQTLTVGAPKRGLVAGEAWEYVGRLEVAADVGLLPNPAEAVGRQTGFSEADGWKFMEAWTLPEDFADFPPARPVASHKGTFGHAVIVAGSLGYHGAAVLAARAAGAARPGLVTVITSPAAYPAVAAQLAFAMVRPWTEPLEFPAKMTALLVGPGLAGADVPEWLRRQTLTWWRELPVPVIADASALDWLGVEHRRMLEAGTSPECLGWLNRFKANGAPRILTPHPGEARRWLSETEKEPGAGRFTQLLSVGSSGSWVVLKGHQTLVRGAAEPTYYNSTGNPGLAQGGSGDVLAGFITGLFAQPLLQREGLRTLRYAVWEHGRAADRLEAQRRNWTAEDLALELGR